MVRFVRVNHKGVQKMSDVRHALQQQLINVTYIAVVFIISTCYLLIYSAVLLATCFIM